MSTEDPTLDTSRLVAVRDAMSAAILEGLAADGAQVRALPAHLPPPPDSTAGDALVIDTGGTNMRAAVVRITPGEAATVICGPEERRLPVRDEGEGLDAQGFFRIQAELAQQVGAQPGLPVGYCFSYPSDVRPNRDARLIRWTKGIDIPGVEGELVGTGLREALAAVGLEPGPVRVLNDTVASLLAGARAFGGTPAHVLGLIAGTGTNMAGFHDAAGAPKLEGLPTPMAINYESGNFSPPHLLEADDAVDAASGNPGQQRFEKAVSGYYLPFVFARLHPDHEGFDPQAGTGPLVELAYEGEPGPPSRTARALLERSADLVAAGLAGALATYPEAARHVGILAEGSLFWRATGYADRVQDTLRTLLAGARTFEILHPEEANLVGAACAALVE